jgi:hypothetical protein
MFRSQTYLVLGFVSYVISGYKNCGALFPEERMGWEKGLVMHSIESHRVVWLEGSVRLRKWHGLRKGSMARINYHSKPISILSVSKFFYHHS